MYVHTHTGPELPKAFQKKTMGNKPLIPIVGSVVSPKRYSAVLTCDYKPSLQIGSLPMYLC